MYYINPLLFIFSKLLVDKCGNLSSFLDASSMTSRFFAFVVRCETRALVEICVAWGGTAWEILLYGVVLDCLLPLIDGIRVLFLILQG